MAQKIKLGARPKTFDKDVEIKMLDGSVGTVPAVFKYRTRTELAELNDEIQGKAQAQEEADTAALKAKIESNEKVEPLKQVDILDRNISLQVDFVMEALEGWGLDEKFGRAAVQQLADELPAAIRAIIETYRTAINEGRLGN